MNKVLFHYQCLKCKVRFFSTHERTKVICPVCENKRKIQLLEVLNDKK